MLANLIAPARPRPTSQDQGARRPHATAAAANTPCTPSTRESLRVALRWTLAATLLFAATLTGLLL